MYYHPHFDVSDKLEYEAKSLDTRFMSFVLF